MLITRRRFGQLATSAALAADASWMWGNALPDLVLILMADLHSGYAYTPALLKVVSDTVAANRLSDVRIVINGDVFESGNVVGKRSLGVIDLEMISRFAQLAPTIVTIGNHDGDLFDPALFVSDVTSRGATLITDITDTRTSALYGPASTSFTVAGRTVRAAAVGTPALGSYAAAFRPDYGVPDPGAYAAANFPTLLANADLHLAFVHSGFLSDQAVLPALTGPFMLQGGHDHLRFNQTLPGGNLHIHSGYWTNGLAIVGVNFSAGGVQFRPRQVQLLRTSPRDPALGTLVDQTEAANLQPLDLAVIGHLPAALDLDHAVLFAAEAVRQAAGADIGLLSHTTFGDGLPAGPVNNFNLAAFVRFDGGFTTAVIDGATLLSTVLPRTNQYGNFPYAQRTGDFLYATPITIDPGKSYRVVVNSFASSSAANQAEYFGTTALSFAPVPSLMLKAIVAAALPA